jgi:glucose/arabinose dehydrogenase
MGRTGIRLIGVVVAIAAITAACMPDPPLGRGPNPTLTVNTLVSNLDHPWDIAFTPTGNAMVYDERGGNMWVRPFPTGTPVLLGNVATLQTSPPFFVFGEFGLQGLALDPKFQSNRYLYACLATNVDARVVRFTTNLTAGSLAIDSTIATWTVDPNFGFHMGCRLRFRPNVNPPQLVVGTGDGFIGTAAQDLHTLAGKVLCITRDGAPCSSNPGVTNPALDIDDRILSWGHRNVQGIALLPKGDPYGVGYSIEHGTDRDDEVNRLVPGNFGWNPDDGAGGYDQTHPMTGPGGIPAVWNSGLPTIAPSGGTFVFGTQWKGWNRALVIALLKNRELFVLFLDDGNGSTNLGTTWALDNLGYRMRSAVQGPDGNLYVSTDNGSGTDVIFQVIPS